MTPKGLRSGAVMFGFDEDGDWLDRPAPIYGPDHKQFEAPAGPLVRDPEERKALGLAPFPTYPGGITDL